MNTLAARSRRVFCPRALIASPPKTKKATGGNDDNDNGANKNLDRIRRMYYGTKEITAWGLMCAMERRWDKLYTCKLLVGDSDIAVLITPNELQCDEDISKVDIVVNALNSYGLGQQFLDYIKYNEHLKEPMDGNWRIGGSLMIPLNVPTKGTRMTEWDI
jgi:hypothetical protein